MLFLYLFTISNIHCKFTCKYWTLIDWCLTPTFAVFQLYLGVSKFFKLQTLNMSCTTMNIIISNWIRKGDFKTNYGCVPNNSLLCTWTSLKLSGFNFVCDQTYPLRKIQCEWTEKSDVLLFYSSVFLPSWNLLK
jgi:hypothetical protein